MQLINPYKAYWGPSPVEGTPILPEDAEAYDAHNLQTEIDRYFDKMYPAFEPEVITSATGKEYYLPALKVLKRVDGEYFSPQKDVRWNDMELNARCINSFPVVSVRAILDPVTGAVRDVVSEPEYIERSGHSAPNESCDCGIYGSVNLEEVGEYVEQCKRRDMEASHYIAYNNQFKDLPGWFQREYKDHYNPKTNFALCIIEPSPDAKVILCRKGWKASQAFISEIVDETISMDEASSLLSIAWHRPIDIRRINENR